MYRISFKCATFCHICYNISSYQYWVNALNPKGGSDQIIYIRSACATLAVHGGGGGGNTSLAGSFSAFSDRASCYYFPLLNMLNCQKQVRTALENSVVVFEDVLSNPLITRKPYGAICTLSCGKSYTIWILLLIEIDYQNISSLMIGETQGM